MGKLLLLTFSSLLFFYSCTNNTPDVSNINVDVKIIRFDSILFSKSVDSINTWLPEYLSLYPEFIDVYTTGIISVGSSSNKNFAKRFEEFISYTKGFEIDKAVSERFKDFNKIESKIVKGLKYYKYYFPNENIPEIYTYISGFNQSITVSENFIGIGLDKYLGMNSTYYTDMTIPRYVRYRAEKRFIPIDIIRALAYNKSDFPDVEQNLLNNIIYEGKIQYFIDKMFPYVADSTKIGYTSKQIYWCNNNEKQVWTWLVNNKKLFVTDYKEVRNFIGEAPFTVELSKESPGRIGVWVGWQIIKKYMKENPDISLADLMKNNDFQRILNSAKYNP